MHLLSQKSVFLEWVDSLKNQQRSVDSDTVKTVRIFVNVSHDLPAFHLLGPCGCCDTAMQHCDPIKISVERWLKAEVTGGNLAVIFRFWPLIGHGVR